MRKPSLLPFVLAAAAILPAGCGGDALRRVKVEIPSASTLRLAADHDLLLAGFLVDKTPAGFDLGAELGNYLTAELGNKLPGRVNRVTPAWPGEALPEDKAFWSGLGGGRAGALILAGRTGYVQEVRKTISDVEGPSDGPWETVKPSLAERRIFTLTIDLVLVRASDGEIVYRREFKETRTTNNVKLPAEYAFFELANRFKTKFFGNVLGDERLQDRILLTR